jgi:hypothetical protein
MEKQPIVISRVEIKKVIDLGFTVCKEERKPRVPQHRRGQFKRKMENGKPHRNLTEHRSKPHTVITSQSPRHC